MFSGIVEAIGIIVHLEKAQDCLKITIATPQKINDLKIGDSICVNGVCLTITDFPEENQLNMTVVPETLRLTNLGKLFRGSLVNIEKPLKNDSRNSGHAVQGHVDGMGELIELKPDGKEALLVKCAIPPSLAKYLVNKGYIAFDGMSLTVIEARTEWFTVTLIPHTQRVTIASQYRLGSLVNLEVDILSKYVEKLMRYNKYANTH
jgi:riboflavin synthase